MTPIPAPRTPTPVFFFLAFLCVFGLGFFFVVVVRRVVVGVVVLLVGVVVVVPVEVDELVVELPEVVDVNVEAVVSVDVVVDEEELVGRVVVD